MKLTEAMARNRLPQGAFAWPLVAEIKDVLERERDAEDQLVRIAMLVAFAMGPEE